MGRRFGLEALFVRIDCGGETLDVRLEGDTAILGDRRVQFRARVEEGRLVSIEIGERVVPLRALRERGAAWIWCRGSVYEARPTSAVSTRARETGNLVAPMPGRIRRVQISEGDRVEKGQVVVILEAMKMEHAIRAPQEGVVAAICFKEGDLVDAGVELVEIH